MAQKAIIKKGWVGVLILNGSLHVTVPSNEALMRHSRGPYMQHLDDLREAVSVYGSEVFTQPGATSLAYLGQCVAYPCDAAPLNSS